MRFAKYDYFQSPLLNDHLFENSFNWNNDVVKLSIDNSIFLKDIPHGNTELHFSRNNAKNNIGSRESTLGIARKNFLEQFGLAALISALVLLLFLYNMRIQRKRKFENQQAESDRVTARFNRLRLTALRSQMNPHFIFNAIGSIQYYIQTQETELSDEYLSDFASLMRRILDNASAENISVQKEIELLRLYVKLEHFRLDEKFDYVFDIEEDLDLDMPIPPMVIQPFVENAIQHGIYHLTERRGEDYYSI